MKYNVKVRLDGILIEVKGVRGETLEHAAENVRQICLTHFLREYKGMAIEYLNGASRVVGVETEDAWD